LTTHSHARDDKPKHARAMSRHVSNNPQKINFGKGVPEFLSAFIPLFNGFVDPNWCSKMVIRKKRESVARITMIIAICQWSFQDPKMELLYHIRPFFAGIFPEI
jgi:hypothetical protein